MGTLVDTETGEVVVLMTEAEARTITAEIKSWAGTLWLKIERAHRGQAWRALGYESWDAYLAAEFDISRSRGYQLVAHARAVRALADAAGIEDVSTMVDTPERVTRSTDTEAAAAEIADEVDALPDDATDEDRAEVVERVTRSHYERTRTAPSGDGPAAPPAADEGAGRAEDADTSPAQPAPAPSGEDIPPQSSPDGPEDPYPDLTYVANALKASGRIYDALKVLDPERLAQASAVEDRPSWTGLAASLRAMADDLDAAFARPDLRRVK